MSKKSEFIMVGMKKSHCPTCKALVTLLTHLDGTAEPAFFICWACRSVWQVGFSKVELEMEKSWVGERK
jgi:hypothetical protein